MRISDIYVSVKTSETEIYSYFLDKWILVYQGINRQVVKLALKIVHIILYTVEFLSLHTMLLNSTTTDDAVQRALKKIQFYAYFTLTRCLISRNR